MKSMIFQHKELFHSEYFLKNNILNFKIEEINEANSIKLINNNEHESDNKKDKGKIKDKKKSINISNGKINKFSQNFSSLLEDIDIPINENVNFNPNIMDDSNTTEDRYSFLRVDIKPRGTIRHTRENLISQKASILSNINNPREDKKESENFINKEFSNFQDTSKEISFTNGIS